MTRLILNGATPAVVSDAIIDEIKSRERGGLVELPRRPEFKPGDQVRIVAGALSGQLGLYQDQRPHERVLVLLGLLGRVELGRDAVEAKPSANCVARRPGHR